MQSASVIDVFEEGADVLAGVFERGVSLAVDLLFLEGSYEPLRPGIIVRVARPAHADARAVVLQPFGIGNYGNWVSPSRPFGL